MIAIGEPEALSAETLALNDPLLRLTGILIRLAPDSTGTLILCINFPSKSRISTKTSAGFPRGADCDTCTSTMAWPLFVPLVIKAPSSEIPEFVDPVELLDWFVGADMGVAESELTLGEEVPSAFVAVALKV